MTRKNNNLSTKRAAIYLRCSTDDQKEGDFSTIDVQREINETLIAERGWTLAGTYSDEGRTGTNLNRPGWKELLADAQAKKFSVVICTYMSRLGRGNAFVIAEYELAKVGVKVEMAREKFTDDLAGYVNRSMTNVMDGMYAQMVRQWTRTKQESMVKAGYHAAGIPPYGYMTETVPGMTDVILPGGRIKRAPRRMVFHPETGEFARRAFELVAETGVIADAQRYLREVDPDRQWPITKVKDMLTNRRYTGEARIGEIVNPAAHPALVNPELWEQVQQRVTARPDELAAIGRAKDEPVLHQVAKRVDPIAYYLRGRVFCQHCATLMTPAGHHGAHSKVGYYECRKTPKGSKCPIARVNADALHDLVTSEITRLAEHPRRFDRFWYDVVRDMPKVENVGDELTRVKRNRRETEKKMTRLVDAIKAGVPARTLASEIANMEELAAKQDRDIAELQTRQKFGQSKRPDVDALRSLWEEWQNNAAFLSEEEKTELLGLLVGPVTLTGRNTEGITAQITLLLSDEYTEIKVFGHDSSSIVSVADSEAIDISVPETQEALRDFLREAPLKMWKSPTFSGLGGTRTPDTRFRRPML